MPTGRPKITWESIKKKLPTNWLQLLEEDAKQGRVELHFRHRFREWGVIGSDQWQRFKAEEPEFRETLKSLLEISAIWWHEEIRASIRKGKEVNAAVLIFGASNCHPEHFRRNVEKSQVSVSAGEVKVSVVRFGEDQIEIEGSED